MPRYEGNLTLRGLVCRSHNPQQINGDTPVLIDFWAEWCGPCRFISPFFGELSEKSENIKFYKVDVDSQKAISEAAGIRAVCFILR